MYGIFAYIWLFFMVNVGKYTIHGWYGLPGEVGLKSSFLKSAGDCMGYAIVSQEGSTLRLKGQKIKWHKYHKMG